MPSRHNAEQALVGICAEQAHLRRWPGDGFSRKKKRSRIPTSVWRRLGRLEASMPGGFYAGHVMRPGFYAGQECGAQVSKPLGEPSNEVGRAIKRGWASQY